MLLIDKLSGKPVYEQVIEGVEENILLGVYKPGDVLPSLRELSVTLGINPNTIQKSYAELIRRGIIVSSPGSGTYVAADAVERIREFAQEKLLQVGDLVAELAMAGIPRDEVVAMVYAVYVQAEKEKAAAAATLRKKGGTNP